MSAELIETLIEPLAGLGLTVERSDAGLLLSADPARVMNLSANGGDLVLAHCLEQAVADTELWERLDRCNRQSSFARFVARDGGVWVEARLPLGARDPAANQLHVACGELDRAIVGYGQSDAPGSTLAIDAAAPPPAIDRGAVTAMEPQAQRPATEPTVAFPVDAGDPTQVLPEQAPPQPASPVAETVELPASYMPGAGQAGSEDSLTRRYGRAAATPGRTEADRPNSARNLPGHHGQRDLMIVGLALLLLGGLVIGGGVLIYGMLSGEETQAEPGPPSPDTEVDSEAPQDAPTADPVDESPDATVPQPTRDPVRPPDPPPAREERIPGDLDGILRWIQAHPERTERGMRAAFLCPEFSQPGGWTKLLDTLGSRAREPEVVKLLAHRVRSAPPPLEDCLVALPTAHGTYRGELIQHAVRCPADRRDMVADVLSSLRDQDTAELEIEVALVQVRRPAPDSLQKLLGKYGEAWLVSGAGAVLLEGLAEDAVGSLAALAKSSKVETRRTVASLCGRATDPRDALKVLSPLLRDPDSGVRDASIESMVALGSPLATWPLSRRLLDEPNGNVASRIRAALHNLASTRAVELLGQLYGRRALRDRQAALHGLEAIGSSDAVRQILRALDDPKPELQLLGLRKLTNLQRQPGLKPHVLKGISRIRELARTRGGGDVARAAGDLFTRLTGSRAR